MGFFSEIFEQGLSAVLSNAQDSISLWCCFLEYLRRRVEDWKKGSCSRVYYRIGSNNQYRNWLCDWLKFSFQFNVESPEREDLMKAFGDAVEYLNSSMYHIAC